MYSSVAYNNNLGDVPARVNRVTGELQLNPRIWESLSRDYKNYILYHEDGHLVLQTTDEAEANRYAIDKFLPIAELSDNEMERRILVLTEITDINKTKAFGRNKPDPGSNESNFDPISLIVTAIGGIVQTLPNLGVGSKSRIKEAQAAAAAAAQIEDAKAKSTTKIMVVGGFMLIAVIIIYLSLKK